MSKLSALLGLGFILGVLAFDWFAWSNLIVAGIDKIGFLVGFGLLAIISIPITIVGFVLALDLIVAD